MRVVMRKFILIFFLSTMSLLSACRAEWLTADSLPWVGAGPVLFQDDFSKETGGWNTHADALSFSEYDQSGFRLSSDVPNYQFWSVPGLNFTDSLVYVRARMLSGPENNLYGVVCRFQNSENFYALMISSDGYYGIFKRFDGQQSMVGQSHMDFSATIQTGDGINDIKAICQGDYLALFVNETRLIQVRDDSLRFGDVGMIVGNLEEAGVNILFDDFVVLKP